MVLVSAVLLVSYGPQMNRQWVVLKTLPAVFHKRVRIDFIQEGILLVFLDLKLKTLLKAGVISKYKAILSFQLCH